MKLSNSKYFNKSIFSWLIDGVFGLIIAYIFMLQLFDLGDIKKAKSFLLFLLFFIIGTVSTHFLLIKYAFPRGRQQIGSRRKLLLWFAGALLAGIFLAVVYPVSLPATYAFSNLDIVTTGEKNPRASDSNVTLSTLSGANRQPIDLSTSRFGSLWKLQDGQVVSMNRKPSSGLHFKASPTETYTLKFITNSKSGIVEINWNGKTQNVDLYSQTPGIYTLQLSPSRFLLFLLKPYWILVAILNGLGLFVLSVFLITQRWGFPKASQPVSQPVSPWLILVYALPMALVWIVTLLVFWPGLMSFDSLDQWYQMTTGQYNDLHPAFHTFTNWLITRIYLSPATIVLFQILTLSLVIGWGFHLFRKAGIPRWACWIPLILLAISPVNNTLIITLWKDIPYSIAMLGLSLIIFQITITNGEWLQEPYAWLLLGLTAALVSLFRHNGFPVVLACFFILGLVFKTYWRSLLFATLLLLVAFWIIVGPVYKLVKVDTSQDHFLLGIHLLHFFAAYANSRVPLSNEGLAVLERIWPSKDPLPYNCYISDTTATRVSPEAVVDNLSDLQQVLSKLIKENPEVAIRHLFCANSIIWEISQPEDGYFFAYELSLYMNNKYYEFKPGQFRIIIHSLLPNIQNLYVNMIETTTIWPIWRPALYFYLSVFCGIIFASRRRSWKYVLFLLPIIFHSLVLFFINSTQEVRYQYPVYLVSLLSLALIFVNRSESDISRDGDEHSALSGSA
jgi:hypothetical protein